MKHNSQVFSFDHTWQNKLDKAPFNLGLLPTTEFDDLAYIVYSSGTTGKPKGWIQGMLLYPTFRHTMPDTRRIIVVQLAIPQLSLQAR